MATITSGKFSLEIRFREIDADTHIQYDVWLRYNGHAVINPAILERDDPYWSDRRDDSLRVGDGVVDGIDEDLIPTLQSALETNQPRGWQPLGDSVSLRIYPDIYFPPIDKDDFETSINSMMKAAREVFNAPAPEDVINLYVQVEPLNLTGARNTAGGIGVVLQVERPEVQAFIDDLKYEYTDLLRRYPHHQEKVRQFKALQLAFDGAPRMLEVYLFQGEMNGWVHINLTADGLQRTVWASNVYPPFKDLTEFLTSIAEDHMPCEFWIDEEGKYKILRAERWGEPHLFRFQMLGPDEPLYETHMDYVFDRRQFVLAFYNDLISFLNTHFQARLWGRDQLVEPECLEGLRRAIDGLGDLP